MADWIDCARNGHRLTDGKLAQLYLELMQESPEDAAALDVARLWLVVGNRDTRWCPACGYFEMMLPDGPASRMRRRSR